MRESLRPAFAEHGNLQALVARGLFGLFVAGVDVARDAEAGVVREYAVESLRGLRRAVGDGDLARVERVAYAHSAAVVEGDPRGAARCVEQRVQDGPVGDGVRAVAHGLGLAEGRGDGARVQVVAADGDGRLQVSALDQLVHRLAHLRALAVAEPAYARGQALELHAVARETHPAFERLVFGEELEREVVRAAYVFGVAGESHPAERPLALAEERAYVLRHEARYVERVLNPRVERLLAYVVPVVEGDRARALEGEHRLDVARHRLRRTLDVRARVAAPQLFRLFEREARGDVSVQGVVRARLVGDGVNLHAASNYLGQDFGAVADESHGDGH